MKLTEHQKAVLEHIIPSAEEWVAAAIAGLGEEKATKAMLAKVARWAPDYEAAVAAGNYKNRVVRDAEEVALITAGKSL